MLRSAAIYFPALLLPKLAAFLTIIFAAHLLPSGEVGYYSLVILIGEAADATATNWARIALLRFGSRGGPVAGAVVRKMGLTILGCTGSAVALGLLATSFLAAERFGDVALGVTFYVVCGSILRFGLALHQASGRSTTVLITEGLRAIVTFGVTVAAMALSSEFLTATLAASACVLVAGVATYIYAVRATPAAGTLSAMPDLLPFAAPLIAIALLTQAVGGLDRAFLKAIGDAAVFATYAVAYQISRSGFDAVAGAFNSGGFVAASSFANSGRLDDAKGILTRQFSFIIAFSLPAGAALIGAREIIAQVLLPASYFTPFVSVAPFLVVGAIALNVKAFVYDNVFHIGLRNSRQLPSLVFGTAAAALVCIVLVPRQPLQGAATAFAVGSLVSLVGAMLLSRRILEIRVDVRSLGYSMALAALTWTIISGCSVLLSNVLPPWVLLIVAATVGGALAGVSLALAWGRPKRAVEDSKLRILHVISSLAIGGTEKLLCDLAGYGNLCGATHAVLIINNDFSDELIELLKARNVETFMVHRPKGSRHPRHLFRSIRYVADFGPDVMHGHSSHAVYWALCCRILGRITPIVRSVHATNIVPRFGRFERWVHKILVDRLTVVSNAILLECRKIGLHAEMIHNGVDLGLYTPRLRPSVSPPVVLTVGRLSLTVKGHDVLVRALGLCSKRGHAFRAMLAGPRAAGEVGAEEALRAMSAQLGLRSQVEFLGTRHDVPLLLADADIFVLPSRHEGFGLALVEAMACGVAVIASDIDGPREIVRNDVDGLLVPPGDHIALADALQTLLTDKALRDRLGAAAATRAKDFAIETAVARFANLYRDVALAGAKAT